MRAHARPCAGTVERTAFGSGHQRAFFSLPFLSCVQKPRTCLKSKDRNPQDLPKKALRTDGLYIYIYTYTYSIYTNVFKSGFDKKSFWF